MKLERSDIKHLLWRKKVDASLFRKEHTPIPNWCAKMWGIAKTFGQNTYTKDPKSKVVIRFEKRSYEGWVTYSRNKDTTYQLWLDKDFGERLKDIFIMSYMRSLEQRLRKDKDEYQQRDIEQEVPFWEFLDFEFDKRTKTFTCKAHYTQKPTFPELFKQLTRSHLLKDMENRLLNKGDFKFVKEDWRPRSEFNSLLERKNIIYYLIDTQRKLLYIGEAEHTKRIVQPRKEMPAWDFFRVDFLPEWLSRAQRLELERLIIRSFASVLPNRKSIPSKEISSYKLLNNKIDTK